MNSVKLWFILYALAIGGGIFALISMKKLHLAFRWIGIYLLAAGIIQFVGGFIYWKVLHISNTPLFSFAIFAYHFILFMVFLNLTERKITKSITIALFGVSAFLMVYLVINQVPTYQLSLKAVVLGCFVYAVSAMLYLLDYMNSSAIGSPIKNSRFIALSGMLFYFSASGVYFAANQLFPEAREVGFTYINQILLVLFYTILTFAIYTNKKRNLSNDVKR